MGVSGYRPNQAGSEHWGLTPAKSGRYNSQFVISVREYKE